MRIVTSFKKNVNHLVVNAEVIAIQMFAYYLCVETIQERGGRQGLVPRRILHLRQGGKRSADIPLYTQDHLGNNRTVTNEDGTVEQIVHYYPFGGTFNDAGLNTGLQQYKYNSKELDRIAGLNTYDYGARQYFSALPVWDRIVLQYISSDKTL